MCVIHFKIIVIYTYCVVAIISPLNKSLSNKYKNEINFHHRADPRTQQDPTPPILNLRAILVLIFFFPILSLSICMYIYFERIRTKRKGVKKLHSPRCINLDFKFKEFLDIYIRVCV